MTEKIPPVLSGQIRDIIEREYATPPIVSGKCWEERATVGIAGLLEPLIQQAKAEVAREIKEEIEKVENPHPHFQGESLVYGSSSEAFEQCRQKILSQVQTPKGITLMIRSSCHSRENVR